jgi:hypothetical protein
MSGVRIVDMPDIGAVTDDSSFVGEHAGSGRFSATAVRDYMGLSAGGFVKKTGDTMSGSLNVTGDVSATGNVGAVGIVGGGTIQAGSGGVTTSGDVTANTMHTFDLTVTNNIATAHITSSGNVTANAVNTADLTASNNILTTNLTSSGNINATGNIAASGNVTASNTVTGNTLHSVGDTTVGNSLVAQKNVHAMGDVNFYMGSSGPSNRILNFAAGVYGWLWSPDGSMQYIAGGASFWVMRSDGVAYNDRSYVAGHGAYVDLSDRRAKTNIVEYTGGLDVIGQLTPMSFERISNPRPDIGFVAQELEAALPQAVTTVGITLPDGTGSIDSADPSLGITTTPIIAALVNTCKELAARVAALEAQPPAREAD